MIEVGSTIGNYKVIEEVGLGGMGMVFKGVDTMLERDVAIKVLRPELTRHKSLVERFRKEAMVLARLSHPNIALLYNLYHQDNLLFMVMEFVRGENLHSALHKKGKLPLDFALNLFSQILDAIGYAHQNGVIHRDLKPSNIMIVGTNTVKVMDFGIARVLGTERMTREGSYVGTLEYMAPEQIRGRESNETTDIYSLGILLYEMLTGQLPFNQQDQYDLMRAHIETPPPLPTLLEPQIPEHVEQAILKSLSKNQEDRFSLASHFKNALFKEGMPQPSIHSGATRPLRETAVYPQPVTDKPKMTDTARLREAQETVSETRRKIIEEARQKVRKEATRFSEEEREKFLEEARKEAEKEAAKLADEERTRLIEEARKQAEEEASRLAADERKRLVEEARKQAEMEAAQRAAKDRERLIEEARKRAEKEAHERVAAEQQRLFEAARKQAEEEAAVLAEKELQKLMLQARKEGEQEAARLADEERTRLLEEAMKKAEKMAAERSAAEKQRLIEEARKHAEKEASQFAADEQKKLVEQARKQAEEEAARLAEEERVKLIEEAHRRAEQEAGQRASAERKRLIEEARKRAEEEASRRAGIERERLVEEARKDAELEAAKLASEVEERLIEEARKNAEQEIRLFAEQERNRLFEEARKQAEERVAQKVAKERERQVEEARKLVEKEAANLAEEEKQRLMEQALAQTEMEVSQFAEQELQSMLGDARKKAEKEVSRRVEKERKRLMAQERKLAKQKADRHSAEIISQHDATLDLSGHPSASGHEGDLLRTTRLTYEGEYRSKLPLILGVIAILVVAAAVAYFLIPEKPPEEPPVVFKADMVSIDGGTFMMGRNSEAQPGEEFGWAEMQRPAHEVTVGPFQIDRTEVTNGEYAQFVKESGHQPPPDWMNGKVPPGQDKWPVRNVSYQDAEAFAAWRSKRDQISYRLPTEAEWEFAAIGNKMIQFPWGNEWVPGNANIGTGTLKPVGSFPKGDSAFGVKDLIGNVGEWTSSGESIYPGNSVLTDEQLKATCEGCYVVRGGSYASSATGQYPMSITVRGFFPPDFKDPKIGFRLVR